MTTKEAVATFDNTHHALRFEKNLKENDVKLTVMPVPREISASCGLSVKFSMDELEKVRNIARTNEIQVKKYYEITMESNKRGYLSLD